MKRHGVKSFSDYVQGLVILDSLISEGELPTKSIAIFPNWIFSEFDIAVQGGKLQHIGLARNQGRAAGQSRSRKSL